MLLYPLFIQERFTPRLRMSFTMHNNYLRSGKRDRLENLDDESK